MKPGSHIHAGASFQLFLGGSKFFLFFNATELLKNWKNQHFICSNLTLFIVLHSPLYFIFFLFFLFFLFLSFFFLFFFFLGGDAPSPPQMTPLGLIFSIINPLLPEYILMCARNVRSGAPANCEIRSNYLFIIYLFNNFINNMHCTVKKYTYQLNCLYTYI